VVAEQGSCVGGEPVITQKLMDTEETDGIIELIVEKSRKVEHFG